MIEPKELTELEILERIGEIDLEIRYVPKARNFPSHPFPPIDLEISYVSKARNSPIPFPQLTLRFAMCPRLGIPLPPSLSPN